MNNLNDNVCSNPLVEGDPHALVARYLNGYDFSPHTRRAFTFDLKKFENWFVARNKEPLSWPRVTVRDLTDFREHLRRERGQAIATCNRALSTLRAMLNWLVEQQVVVDNPAKKVKELRRQPLVPKGLDPSIVRRLLREVQLRDDVRAEAIFALLLYTGARVGDAVALTLDDVVLHERSGHVVYRFGKGNKERTVPVPLPCRQALAAYLGCRPPITSDKVFVGERGPLTEQGVRTLCNKYAVIIGVRLNPHSFRHTYAHRFLGDNGNDLVGLAQLMGHENVATTARYGQRSQTQLAEAAERLSY